MTHQTKTGPWLFCFLFFGRKRKKPVQAPAGELLGIWATAEVGVMVEAGVTAEGVAMEAKKDSMNKASLYSNV